MTNKRLEGRSEPILDPDLPIVDTHQHLFHKAHLRYLLDDYLADAQAGHRIIGSVYVEAKAFYRQDGNELLRPLGEVEFANGAAAMSASGEYGDSRICAGIVGYADMREGARIAELLDAAMDCAPQRFRGVRQVSIEHPDDAPFRFMMHRPQPGVLRSDGFPAAMQQLAQRGLSFDACIFHHQIPEIAAVADAFPDTTIVLDHLGFPIGLDLDEHGRGELLRHWRELLRDLARRPNVCCKIGGLGMPWWGFGFERRADPIGYLELAAAWHPYVETAIELFGPQRCMMESNMPPDGRSCGFVPLWNALKFIVKGCSADEKAALFHGTAIRLYRLQLPDALLGAGSRAAGA